MAVFEAHHLYFTSKAVITSSCWLESRKQLNAMISSEFVSSVMVALCQSDILSNTLALTLKSL